MSDKLYITAEQLLEDSFRLGVDVLESGFRPKYIVGVWRGGTPVGIAVQELLDYFGVKTDHIPIRTALYTGIDARARRVRVYGLNYIIDQISPRDGLLIVDDVFDSGLSIRAVVRHLKRKCRANMPRDLRVATAYYKPGNNRTDRVPDYFVHETSRWLVFPHELQGLSEQEIARDKPGAAPIVEALARLRAARAADGA